ncbi:hypothetical protein DFJ73DRAFT_874846 [Zopfochytrium polystomum]|nr:hypothetical protein DFJ73DRAFT_874846 [Zopfochytrium polystomum]
MDRRRPDVCRKHHHLHRVRRHAVLRRRLDAELAVRQRRGDLGRRRSGHCVLGHRADAVGAADPCQRQHGPGHRRCRAGLNQRGVVVAVVGAPVKSLSFLSADPTPPAGTHPSHYNKLHTDYPHLTSLSPTCLRLLVSRFETRARPAASFISFFFFSLLCFASFSFLFLPFVP